MSCEHFMLIVLKDPQNYQVCIGMAVGPGIFQQVGFVTEGLVHELH